MDRFLKKRPIDGGCPSSSKQPSSKKAKQGNVSAAQRAREYASGKFYESGGKLFCRSCNVVVDHVRKSIVDQHLKSKVRASTCAW